MEKLPFSAVLVPAELPFTRIDTPLIGAPLLSNTVPVIADWANRWSENNKAKKKIIEPMILFGNGEILHFIIVGFSINKRQLYNYKKSKKL
jgi:hypothetical protein